MKGIKVLICSVIVGSLLFTACKTYNNDLGGTVWKRESLSFAGGTDVQVWNLIGTNNAKYDFTGKMHINGTNPNDPLNYVDTTYVNDSTATYSYNEKAGTIMLGLNGSTYSGTVNGGTMIVSHDMYSRDSVYAVEIDTFYQQ